MKSGGRSHIHLQWNHQVGIRRFGTGVSLHSHTLHSKESLDFIYGAAREAPILATAIRRGERRYREVHGTELDLARAWWTPPLGAHEAWQLEKDQIEGLDRRALISITDHDDLEAPISLQLLDECRGTPVSTEWTLPFRSTFFHLGVHNLAPADARTLFREMSGYTADPVESRLDELLAALASDPGKLIVFNHPPWDERGIGQSAHNELARLFIRQFGPSIHALELNGLRPWGENRAVRSLAETVGTPVISGGDRHAIEPNAILNLTRSSTFAEFAEEIRAGWSDVMILPQYRESYVFRIVHNMFDVLKTYDKHAKGWKLWSDRAFFLCDGGNVRSLTELFGSHPPAAVAVFVAVMQFASAPHIRRFLRGAFFGLEEVAL